MNESGWQLSGNAAENYERYMVPVHCVDRAADLLDGVEVRPGEDLLDVACGTAAVARQAVRRVAPGGSVTGLELNAGMLEVARHVTAYCDPPIEFVEGNAQDIPLPDGRFDVAVCQQALQFIPDQAAALKEVRRVLRPGGRFGLNVWRSEEYSPGFAHLIRALEEHLGKQAADIMRTPFVTPSVDALSAQLREAEFADVRVAIRVGSLRYPSAEEFVWREIQSMPVPDLQKDMSEAREVLSATTARALAPYVDDYGLVFPFEDYVALARR